MYADAERKEEQHAGARCCPLRFERLRLGERRDSSWREHGSAEEHTDLMDARNVRIGETGLEQLIQWLRQTGRPQTLESLTEQYLVILKELVLSEEVR